MDNVHLNPLSFSVNNPDLFVAFLLTFEKIVLQERRDLFGRESMKIDPVLDGNLNGHKGSFKFKVESSKCVNLKLITQNSQLSISQLHPDHSKNLMKHRPRQFTGLGVLLAWVIGGDQRNSSEFGVGSSEWNLIDPAVAK